MNRRKERQKMINKLISKITINNMEEGESTTLYYVVKDESFGIKIVEKAEENGEEKTILEIKNILNDESKVTDLIKILVNSKNDINQINYIIDDFMQMEVRKVCA